MTTPLLYIYEIEDHLIWSIRRSMSLLLLLLVMKSLRASNNVMDGQQIYFYYNTSVVYLFNMNEYILLHAIQNSI